MNKLRALLVFGARPNYMKIAPLYRQMIRTRGCEPILVNTGQHFDRNMAQSFVETLDLPRPDIHLEIGLGSQAQHIARVLERLEPVLTSVRPDVTVVVGDVSSSLAAALASATVGIPVAHVEAGLRSNDWSMPEERNRVLTDRLAQYLFTPSQDGDENLRAEGIEAHRIFCVGNVMIDSLDWVLQRLSRDETKRKYAVPEAGYGVVTLHRPTNVDNVENLGEIVRGLRAIAERIPLFFPVHPRTQKRLQDFGLGSENGALRLLPPLPYPEFIALLRDAAIVLTDSGGIQEEATVLGTPCLTLRQNTERPITLKTGLNELVQIDSDVIARAAYRVLEGDAPQGCRPPLWDGKTAERIVGVLLEKAAAREPNRESWDASDLAMSVRTHT